MAGSGLEDGIIQQVYRVEAISAVKAIHHANLQGLKIYNITQNNLAAVLPALQVSADVKADITSAINAGKEVLVPERTIQVNQWNGVGYIVTDPLTGAGAYLISGGLSGGSGTEEDTIDEILKKLGKGFLFLDKIAALGIIVGVGMIIVFIALPAVLTAVAAGTLAVFWGGFVAVLLIIAMAAIIYLLYTLISYLLAREENGERHYYVYGYNAYPSNLLVTTRMGGIPDVTEAKILQI